MHRRVFIQCSGSQVLPFLLDCRPDKTALPVRKFGLEKIYLRPPGALPEALFVEACINCIACAEACPTTVKAVRVFPGTSV